MSKIVAFFFQHENEQYKANLQSQQKSLQQQFRSIKDELDEKMKAKNALVESLQEKIALYQQERDTLKNELNSRQQKDNAIKEQIISIFGN